MKMKRHHLFNELTNPWLMEIPSLARSPVAPVLLSLSEPARSTKLNLAFNTSNSSEPPSSSFWKNNFYFHIFSHHVNHKSWLYVVELMCNDVSNCCICLHVKSVLQIWKIGQIRDNWKNIQLERVWKFQTSERIGINQSECSVSNSDTFSLTQELRNLIWGGLSEIIKKITTEGLSFIWLRYSTTYFVATTKNIHIPYSFKVWDFPLMFSPSVQLPLNSSLKTYRNQAVMFDEQREDSMGPRRGGVHVGWSSRPGDCTFF